MHETNVVILTNLCLLSNVVFLVHVITRLTILWLNSRVQNISEKD